MEKLVLLLKKLVAEKFYGAVTIMFENGKVTSVETSSVKKWSYKDLPDRP